MTDIKQTISDPKDAISPPPESGRISLATFWRGRNLDEQLLLDRLTVQNISILVAYAG